MTDKPLNKGPHDMGGTAAGPIDTADHGMRFWEKQANALRSTLTGRNIVRLDALRRAVEDLGDQYYRLEYFERTTAALRTVLLEKGLFTEAELKAKMAEVRARFDLPRESRSPFSRRRPVNFRDFRCSGRRESALESSPPERRERNRAARFRSRGAASARGISKSPSSTRTSSSTSRMTAFPPSSSENM